MRELKRPSRRLVDSWESWMAVCVTWWMVSIYRRKMIVSFYFILENNDTGEESGTNMVLEVLQVHRVGRLVAQNRPQQLRNLLVRLTCELLDV